MNKFGYWTDWTGACHLVEVLGETTDGRWVVDIPSLGVSIVDKDDIRDIEEEAEVKP